MYDVWFRRESMMDDELLFITAVPSLELAQRIAKNLMDEGFCHYAWVD